VSTADIVIIGGGVIGASIAFHLTRTGAKDVVLVEKGAIGSGETSKSGGFIQTHWDTLAEVRLIARSREMFASWSEIVGGDCGFVRGGYLHVTGSEREADVRRVHDMLIAEGLESHYLAPAECAEIQPLLDLTDLVGGAWEPASGWADPVATTRTLAAAARARGADIREHTRVTRILRAGGAVTGVETTAGAISARAVINAAGVYAPRLHAVPEIPLPIDVRRGQCGYMSRPNGFPVREIGFYCEVTGLYTHPAGDVNLIGRDRGMPFVPVPDPDAYATDVDNEWIVRATSALAQRLPALGDSVIQRGVTGLYDFTPDDQPILEGPFGLTGYYVAAGFSGVGFKSAPMTGLAMAELVLDGRTSTVDISHLRFERFLGDPANRAR
jgi:sarcosine oxidase, subunit beta